MGSIVKPRPVTAFQPGHKKKGGRKPGIPNKSTSEAKAFCQKIVNDPKYRQSLKKRLIDGKGGQLEVLMWYYAHGKPKETFVISPDLSNLSDEELKALEMLVRRI